MNESQLIRHIKAHIARGDKAKDKAEQHYIAAGQYLKELKDDCPDQKTFLEKVEKEVGIGKSRTYELLQIGDGSKTVAGVRADTAKRVAKHEQSCPLANGQNADTPEASAEAMKAKFADNEAVIEAPACRDLDLDRLREAWESACESAREAFRLNATFDIGAEDSAPAISERIFSELGVKKTERIVALLRKRLKAIDPNCRLCKGTGFTQILEFRGPCGGK
ncbi:MAG: hypothetical protein E6G76_03995, partial [Alphaproteobacteria bacterium]